MHCVSCIGRQILDHWATRESESEVAVVSDSVTPWTVAYQAPQSIEFSRQEYWSGLPFPSPGDLPNPETEPRSPALQAKSSVGISNFLEEISSVAHSIAFLYFFALFT